MSGDLPKFRANWHKPGANWRHQLEFNMNVAETLAKQKALVLDALVKFRDDPQTVRRPVGICSNLAWELHGEVEHEQRTRLERSLFKAWPEYSGHPDYPVPSEGCDPARAYNNTDDQWDPDSAYGAARWRLLAFMISELTRDAHTAKEPA